MHRERWVLGLVVLGATVLSCAVTAVTYKRANNTWITISGEVEQVASDSFTLDYGTGLIAVQIDWGEADASTKAYRLVAGDKVTVDGKIAAGLYETTRIEARSVYVEKQPQVQCGST